MTTTRLSVRTLIAVAGVAACAGAPTIAQEASPVAPASQSSVQSALDAAATLLAEGKVVKARTILADLTSRSGLARLSDSERERALTLAQNASRRLKSLTPVEVSLQTAQDALERDDLALAVAQANAVVHAPRATNEQASQAREVVTAAQARQTALLPDAVETIARAEVMMDAGDAAGARAGLEKIQRWGVALSADQRMTLDSLLVRVSENRADGRTAPNTSLGMLQPGVVKRPTEPAPQEQPADAAPQPEPTPVQPEPTPDMQAQPEPTPAQPAVDPIAQARAWEAQALLTEADVAFSENRLGDARDRYRRLVNEFRDQLAPADLARAQDRLNETMIRLGNQPTDDLLDDTIAQTQAQRQLAQTEFSSYLEQARAALTQGDTQRARQLAAQAQVRMTSSREVFSNAELEQSQATVNAVLAEIDAEERRIAQETVARQNRENQDAAAIAAEQQREDRDRRINEAIDRVRALQMEMKYDEALQVVESNILFLDPINPTGLLLRDVLTESMIFKQHADINRARNVSMAREVIDNNEAMILPDDLVEYPRDWPAISETRGTPVAFTEAEENRRALTILQTKRIPVSFDETPLENALSFIATITQLNVDVDWQSLENQGIDRGTTVSLNLSNVTVETVLNRVMEKISPDAVTGAAWTISDGVLFVASKEQINRQRTLAIYDIRDLIVEVPDYNDAPEFNLQQALQASPGRRGGGGGGGQGAFDQGGDEDPERRTVEERTNDIIEIITTNVDPDGWRDNGGETGFIQQLGGLLIITNTPANHRAIHSLLGKLREYRAMQINVETRFLLVSQDFFEQIGFDLDVYFNANNNQVRTARATRPNTRASDFFQASDGTPFRFGGANPQPILSPIVSPTGTAQAGRSTIVPDGFSPIGAGQNSLGLSESLIGTDFAQDVFATSPALGIAGQFLDDIQVDFLIKATQADRRTVSLTAPRLTFTNGQRSWIAVTTQVSFVADLQPVTSESAVGFDPDPQAIPEGVVLNVSGTVSADRRYVTLDIDTGVNRIDAINNLAISAVAGGQLVNSAAVQSFIQLPQVTATQVKTTATVPDQGTILLGGQRLTTEQEVESGVPVLSKIPVMGRLFSNRVTTKEEQTLLILLKPTVLIQNELEDRSFPGLDDSLRNPFGG